MCGWEQHPKWEKETDQAYGGKTILLAYIKFQQYAWHCEGSNQIKYFFFFFLKIFNF